MLVQSLFLLSVVGSSFLFLFLLFVSRCCFVVSACSLVLFFKHKIRLSYYLHLVF